MAGLAWVMMGIAIWHFTVFLPDRFWAGIVGTFLFSILGAVLFGFAIHGFNPPSQDDTNVITALEAIPGTLLGLAACWLLGVRREEQRAAHGRDAFGPAT